MVCFIDLEYNDCIFMSRLVHTSYVDFLNSIKLLPLFPKDFKKNVCVESCPKQFQTYKKNFGRVL